MSWEKEFFGAFLRWCASPLGFWLLAALLLATLGKLKKRRSKIFLFLLLWVLAMPATGKTALNLWGAVVPARLLRGRAEAVVVLSGGAVHDGWGYSASTASTRRLRAALRITTRRPMLICGIESPLLGSWLTSQGFSNADFELETKSLDTRSNLEEAAKRLSSLPKGSQVALVTDRFHRPRALLWAKVFAPNLDWRAAPVPNATMTTRLPFDLLPSHKGLEYTSLAAREVMAWLRDYPRALMERRHQEKK